MIPTEKLIRTMPKIWRAGPGKYFFVCTKSKTGKWKDHPFKRTQMDKAVQFVLDHYKDHDCYMSTHGFSKNKRLKQYSEDPSMFYADLDECDPRTLDIKPTYAFESSPGRYVGFWRCDEPVPEELNRRMTYHIGSDASGWDRTQVLRIPGTINHKPEYKKPKVKLLWADGPRHSTKKLEKMIPEVENDKGQVSGGEATEIYAKYEKRLPIWLRKELVNPKVQQGKRSEVLWKMICECLEAGMTQDECFEVCWNSPWNKHAERRNGEDQMDAEIEKALGQHVGGSAKRKEPSNVKAQPKNKDARENDPTHAPFFTVIPMSDVVEENVHWLVPNMFARGECSIVEGDPGVGKSYWLMWIAMHLCDGKRLPWLDKKYPTPKPIKIAYFDTENSMATITKTRLEDNGFKNQQNYYQLQEVFDLGDENALDALEEQLLEGVGIDMLVIDPITPYLGGADSHNAKDVRQALTELCALAREYDFSLVLVRHLNKSSNAKALYAGGGSIGFAGLARVVATVGWHPEEPDVRVVACTKNNLSMPFGSLGYTINSLPDTVNRDNRSELEYIGHMDYTSDDIVGTANTKEDNSKDIAADMIRELMKEPGFEINYHSLIAQADKRSISEKSIKNAAAELGLKKVSRGKGKTRKTFLVDQSEE